MSNSLDPDQAGHFVGPGLDPKCLQRLSADDTSRQRVQVGMVFRKVNSLFILFISGHHRQTVLPYSPVLRQTYVRRQGAPAYVASSTGQPLRYGVGLLHVGASTTTSQTHQSPTQQASSTLRYINRPYP